jgi:hypothetical protein
MPKPAPAPGTKGFGKNVSRIYHKGYTAGKGKQAVAIAYSEARREGTPATRRAARKKK